MHCIKYFLYLFQIASSSTGAETGRSTPTTSPEDAASPGDDGNPEEEDDDDIPEEEDAATMNVEAVIHISYLKQKKVVFLIMLYSRSSSTTWSPATRAATAKATPRIL